MAANGMVVLFGFFRLLSALSIFFFLSKYIFKPNVILLAGSCNTITRHVTFCTCYIYMWAQLWKRKAGGKKFYFK